MFSQLRRRLAPQGLAELGFFLTEVIAAVLLARVFYLLCEAPFLRSRRTPERAAPPAALPAPALAPVLVQPEVAVVTAESAPR